jgi:hypothetical protein
MSKQQPNMAEARIAFCFAFAEILSGPSHECEDAAVQWMLDRSKVRVALPRCRRLEARSKPANSSASTSTYNGRAQHTH